VRNLLQEWQVVNGAEVLALDNARWNTFVSKLEGAPLSTRAQNILKNTSLCN
jgi:hypothetical protein